MNYLDWHYFVMWPKILGLWRNLTLFPFFFFAIPHHVKTLFAPWKRQLFKQDLGFNLEEFIKVVIINWASRILGAVIRIQVILYGLILTAVLCAAGLLPVILWIVIPLATLPWYLSCRLSPENQARKLLSKSKGNLSLLLLSLLKQDEGKFLVNHLGFLWSNLYLYFQNQKDKGDPEGFNKYVSSCPNYHISDLFKALSLYYPPLTNFITNNHITAEDIYQTALWYENLQKISLPLLIFDFDRIRKIPGIGANWAYGYTVVLDKYTTDLTMKNVTFPILLGREKEISKLESVLVKTQTNNALIVGEPGTARRRIVETLAHRIQMGLSNKMLTYKRILYLDMHLILASKPSIGEVKGHFSQILWETTQAGNIILVIQEIDKYLSFVEGSTDFSDVFTKFAESPVALIGITTPGAYHKHIEKNPTLSPLFEKIDIDQPDLPTVLLEIEMSIVPVLERNNNLTITYQAVKKTIEDAHKYLSNTPFPAKAIDLLDQCATYVVTIKKEQILTYTHIEEFLSEKYHVPLGILQKSEKEKLINLENLFRKRIIAQERAIRAISSAVRRARLEISNPKKPVAGFLFLGPTGVGKTETAKVLSQVYFGSEDRMLRFDMSQYHGEEGFERLIGSLKLGTPGELTARLTDQPFSVLLFDEFEKADKAIYDLFLTILDEGYISDAFGKMVSARNTIIIATSNAGSQYIRESINMGLPEDKIQTGLIDYIQKHNIFSPELINRFDGVIVFSPLSEGSLREVTKIMLDDLNKRLSAKYISVDVNSELIRKLTNLGFDPQFGARSIKRAIADLVEDQVAQKLLAGDVKMGEKIQINL